MEITWNYLSQLLDNLNGTGVLVLKSYLNRGTGPRSFLVTLFAVADAAPAAPTAAAADAVIRLSNSATTETGNENHTVCKAHGVQWEGDIEGFGSFGWAGGQLPLSEAGSELVDFLLEPSDCSHMLVVLVDCRRVLVQRYMDMRGTGGNGKEARLLSLTGNEELFELLESL